MSSSRAMNSSSKMWTQKTPKDSRERRSRGPAAASLARGCFWRKERTHKNSAAGYKIMAKPIDVLRGDGNGLGGGGGKVGEKVRAIACPTGQIDRHPGRAGNLCCAQQKAQNEVTQQCPSAMGV